MTLSEYQQLAARTINPTLARSEQLSHGLFGLCGEVGEIHSLFQKEYQGHDYSDEHLLKEIGDCLWMLAEICTSKGLCLEDAGITNIEKLKARFPEGFSSEKSLNRAEGDI